MLIMAFINMLHFILRRKESKSEAQIYFIILFVFFMLFGLNNIMIGIQESKYLFVSYGISVVLVSFLFACGLALIQKTKWSRAIGSAGLIYSLLFISLGQSHLFESWGVEELAITVNQAVTTIITVVSLIIIGYFLIKTRLSPLLGLFFGNLLPFTYFLIVIISGVPLNDTINVTILLLVNIFMFLGFKGKLSFFERTKS